MPRFMLLLHDRPSDFADVTPGEMQRIIKEYGAWADRLRAAGKLAGSEKLKDEGGRVIAKDGAGVTVTDGPYAEANEVLGGYFTIEAADYDEAVALARDCPHVTYGARIEVRQIDEIH